MSGPDYFAFIDSETVETAQIDEWSRYSDDVWVDLPEQKFVQGNGYGDFSGPLFPPAEVCGVVIDFDYEFDDREERLDHFIEAGRRMNRSGLLGDSGDMTFDGRPLTNIEMWCLLNFKWYAQEAVIAEFSRKLLRLISIGSEVNGTVQPGRGTSAECDGKEEACGAEQVFAAGAGDESNSGRNDSRA